ncbi:FAD-binding oxidoreductase [Streptomyces sp. NBC_01012]|uniref:FAD-binding oxidoreductase n=1 Tax=Streptomyces sp. NBC_01012 TaxID=2903717 RepID=UPI00386D9EB5|nr:FAD-binding oxidoreductase [Streptomyces sp. NBC_01012]
MPEQLDRRALIRYAGVGLIAAVGGPTALTALGGGAVPSARAAAREETGPALLRPGDPGFDAECSGFNPIVRHRPKAVALPADAAETAEAVRYARYRGWPIAVQATGHGIGVAADGALLINTRKLTGVHVDPAARTARIEAGLRWGPVVDAIAPYGLAALSGSSVDVGAVGYTLGGGLGLLGRRYGYAADRVRSLRIVTPDGRIRTASPTRNRELFWGARGAKSNFGVVTSADIELFPVARVHGGVLNFPGAKAAAVLDAYRAWTGSLTEATTSSFQFLRLPDDPALPPPLRGQFIVSIALGHLGSAADGDELVRPLRALGPFMDTVGERPYAEFAAMFTEGPTSLPIHERTGLVRTLDASTADLLLDMAGPGATLPTGVVSIRHLGGALGRPAPVPNAIGLRDAAFTLYLANPADPEAADATRRTQQRLMNGLRPALTGGAFPNFLGHADDTTAKVRAAYSAADYARLRRLKRACDPSNLFRVNHNIPPA